MYYSAFFSVSYLCNFLKRANTYNIFFFLEEKERNNDQLCVFSCYEVGICSHPAQGYGFGILEYHNLILEHVGTRRLFLNRRDDHSHGQISVRSVLDKPRNMVVTSHGSPRPPWCISLDVHRFRYGGRGAANMHKLTNQSFKT